MFTRLIVSTTRYIWHLALCISYYPWNSHVLSKMLQNFSALQVRYHLIFDLLQTKYLFTRDIGCETEKASTKNVMTGPKFDIVNRQI